MATHLAADWRTDSTALTETNAMLIYIPVGVFLVICPLVVGTRIWSRVVNGGRLGIDDYTILVSLAFALASDGIMLAACRYGYGRHVISLSTSDRFEAFKYFYLCQVTYKACINLTKASILLLYLRIFSGVLWFRWMCRFVLTCVIMYCIASVTATIFQCTPITKAFDKSIEGSCIDNGHFWYANAGFSITTDVLILILPIPLVYVLRIPNVQKVALIMVFALGVFVVITSCLRVTTIDIQATTPDQTYDVASTMWTVIEMNVAIVCACLPQIRPLIVKMFPKLMPTYRSGSHEQSYEGARKQSTHMEDDERAFPRFDGGRRGHADCVDNKEVRAIRNSISWPNIRKGGTSSEEHMLQDDLALRIHKTVQYSVEYSAEKEVTSR
ncbi:hypothetical protein GGS23DRAFT_604921 [Durotheca rogersii]|uniref:uncharacterized protein n=1 Tax=Durotheca rogersii TaxID=419775 RepID=UPI00221FA6C0|nr:uncharacterized protein GGS23DRAFT_604921 [Durotheca rogersii]KAI5863307.1 hypothetical protein GGS23DRAFT_604921 [Durotheca rogersii]